MAVAEYATKTANTVKGITFLSERKDYLAKLFLYSISNV